jgi:hypothetical protein
MPSGLHDKIHNPGKRRIIRLRLCRECIGAGSSYAQAAVARQLLCRPCLNPHLRAEGEPDDEPCSHDGQNDGYERASAPCRTPAYAGVSAPAT